MTALAPYDLELPPLDDLVLAG
ncbi:MAG: hypothetical protein QOG46_1749, partial [Pseudonocardiales bacterium]|nr:hypothetical protein [Pseudonocardiales bacterium]